MTKSERKRASDREWYVRNREAHLAKLRERYAADPDRRARILAGAKAWQQANPERVREIQRAASERRRAARSALRDV